MLKSGYNQAVIEARAPVCMLKLINACCVGMLVLCLSACGPYSAVGMVGSTLIKTVDDRHQREAIAEPKRLEIARANFLVGAEYIRQGDYETARIRLNKAREVKPDYAPAYNALGVLYQGLGEVQQAEENFKHSLKLDKDNPGTMNNYGQFLCSQGRLDEAEELFNLAAADPLYRTPEVALTNAGSCVLMEGRERDAIAYFEQALKINPSVARALYAMADIEYGKQNYFAANSYLKRYLDVAKHTPQTLWLGVRLQRILGDKDLLASYTLLLRNKFPDSREAKLLLSGSRGDADDSLPYAHLELIHDFEFITEASLLSDKDLLPAGGNLTHSEQ